jgi:MATE family multidrug resistance protein
MHRPLQSNWPVHWWGRLEWVRLQEILRIGVPASGQLLFEVGAFTVAAWMMGRIGTVALAAHQIALSCASLTFMFPLGLSMAAGMRVSQALGAGQRYLVRPIGYGALGMACLVMGTFGVVFWLAGPAIARSFVDDTAVVSLAGQLLTVAALFQLFDGTQTVGSGLLRGLSDMKVPTAITFVAYWCLMLPLAYGWGVLGHSPIGVWKALAFGLACAAVLLAGRFYLRTRVLCSR